MDLFLKVYGNMDIEVLRLYALELIEGTEKEGIEKNPSRLVLSGKAKTIGTVY